ncbi:hypothetical protein G9A89_010760, partial [Geosiphon pyriformis]
DTLVRKNLRFKTGLSCDFFISLISFSNVCGILGCLFEHKFLDLQVLKWFSLNFLQYFVKLKVSPVNKILISVVKILLENELSLANNLPNAFCGSGKFLMSGIFNYLLYYDSVFSLKHFGIAFGNRLLDKKGRKKLDPRGLILYWFTLAAKFINKHVSLKAESTNALNLPVLSVLDSEAFSDVHSSLMEIWFNCIEIYTNELLKSAGSAKMASGAAAYFPATNMGVGIRVHGLLFSILAELQAIALVLECILFSCAIVLYSDSQFIINTYVSEIAFAMPDFHNCNIRANELAENATCSLLFLPVGDIYQLICHARWKTGPGYNVILNTVVNIIDWATIVKIWHPDSHMLFGSTSRYFG